MKQKIAVTLDEALVAFLDTVAQGNRSDYLNKLLSEHRKKVLKDELIAVIQSDLEDPEYRQEIATWDCVAGDGIDAER